MTVGFALCGSFCTFSRVLEVFRGLTEKYDVIPIMSENAAHTDTRFGKICRKAGGAHLYRRRPRKA